MKPSTVICTWSFNFLIVIFLNCEIAFPLPNFPATPPNGLDHLPPGLARRQNHDSTKNWQMAARTSAGGGQVETVLGGFFLLHLQSCFFLPHNQAGYFYVTYGSQQDKKRKLRFLSNQGEVY
jgi:hypothetical protein